MINPDDYTYVANVLTFVFPGDFTANLYFDENPDDSSQYFFFSIDPCPLTLFIESTPNPYIFDGLSVQIPEL
jgi:hypothetical protein